MYCRPMAITPKKYNMASNDMLGSLGISGRWQCFGKTAIWASGTMFVSLSSVWLYHKKIHWHIAITHALHLAVYFSKVNMMSCITFLQSFLFKQNSHCITGTFHFILFIFFNTKRLCLLQHFRAALSIIIMIMNSTADRSCWSDQWLFWENVNLQIPSISSFTTAIIRIRLNTG